MERTVRLVSALASRILAERERDHDLPTHPATAMLLEARRGNRHSQVDSQLLLLMLSSTSLVSSGMEGVLVLNPKMIWAMVQLTRIRACKRKIGG